MRCLHREALAPLLGGDDQGLLLWLRGLAVGYGVSWYESLKGCCEGFNHSLCEMVLNRLVQEETYFLLSECDGCYQDLDHSRTLSFLAVSKQGRHMGLPLA